MENNIQLIQRTFKSFQRQFKKRCWDFSDCPDPRKEGKTTHSLSSIIYSLLLGLATNQKTLRDVERNLPKFQTGWFRKRIPQSISDTTLYETIDKLPLDVLHDKLTQQIRTMHRSKQLRPHQLPFGTVTIDGKNMATLLHDAEGYAHHRTNENKKWFEKIISRHSAQEGGYYIMPVLRATLTSCEAKPCIYQHPLPPGTGENTVFAEVLDGLHHAYGESELFRLIDVDAGMTSLENANLITSYGYYYLMGLKENQPTLFSTACDIMTIRRRYHDPECTTAWEKRNGKKIRRLLWRSRQLSGFNTSAGVWDHLTEIWLVRQETCTREGNITIEDRYFLVSIPTDTLTPQQIVGLVRNHWGIENNVFNSLDIQWEEDAAPWCTQGQAVFILGLLRLMAYNLVQFARTCTLCRKKPNGTRPPPLSWRAVFEIVMDVFRTKDELAAAALSVI